MDYENTQKQSRQRRISQKQNHVTRQNKIRSYHGMESSAKVKKLSGTTCGNSNCFMCGNPRKFFGDLTFQEQCQMQNFVYDEGGDCDVEINYET